jgi:hypothetical protein
MTHPPIAPAFALAASLALAPAAWAAGDVTCVTVETASLPASHGAAGHFSARAILDLTFTVLFRPDTSGDHLLELDVFTPDGHLYRSLAVPITASNRSAGSRRVPGYPRPLQEQKLARVTRGNSPFLAVDVPFPVAGTDIVAAGLYGTWRLEARLDGRRNPCANAVSFSLAQ